MKLELSTLAPILLIYQVRDKTKIQIISINHKYSQMHTATLLLLIPHLQNIMTDCLVSSLVRTPTPLCIIVTFLHILHPIQKYKSEQQQLCRRSYLFCGYILNSSINLAELNRIRMEIQVQF